MIPENAGVLFSNITQLIGNCPIVQINAIEHGGKSAIYGKLEYLNPFGSVKDRTAIYLIRAAEAEGKLRPGGGIVESTSGNLGHSLAAICAVLGYQLTCVVDPKMPAVNLNIFRALGAEIEFVDQPDESGNLQLPRIERARQLAKEKGFVNLDQYNNPVTALAHYKTTGPEVFAAMGEDLDVLVGCVGTGGHLCGTSRFLKERLPRLVTVGVEPVGSVIFGGCYQPTKQNGVGLSFIPGNYDPHVVDREVKCSDEVAFSMIRRVARKDGILLGGSSGAVLAAAGEYASESDEELNILCLLPDGGIKYVDSLYASADSPGE